MTLVSLPPHVLARSTSDGGGPVTRKEFRIGRSQGNLARTPDVVVVISLKLVYTPVDDNVTATHKSQVTSHFEASKQASFMGPVDDSVTTN